MLESVMQYAKKSDIIIFVPEYSHFYNDLNCSSEELFRTVFECNKQKIKLLNFQQICNCFLYSGNYILSKFDITEYINVIESDIYSVNSLNKYGDVDAHWALDNYDFKQIREIDIKKYNPKIMTEIKRIANKLQEKGCILFISYPGFHFNNSVEAIQKIENEYKANGFTVLGTPQRYTMPDSLFFEIPYHLNKQGVDLRTNLLIEDLKNALNNIDSLKSFDKYKR
jgi:hypothetical protein